MIAAKICLYFCNHKIKTKNKTGRKKGQRGDRGLDSPSSLVVVAIVNNIFNGNDSNAIIAILQEMQKYKF